MFLYNGIVYGGEPKKGLSVLSMKILPDKIMLITFSNGEERLFDARILEGEVFHALEEEENFKSAYIDHGVITWMNGEIDCAPDYMYSHSYEYVSPAAGGKQYETERLSCW